MRAAGASQSRIWAAAVLSAGWIAALAVSWPGQLSYDSIVQLHDGRTGFYHSWHPAVMAWLLGLGDSILPGAGLFIVFDAALFFGALLSLLWLRSRVSPIAVAVAIALLFLPQCILYQGIVWKDVLFADCAVAGFVCLAHVEVRWECMPLRFALLAASLALFVLAAMVRQNGFVVLAAGLVVLGFIAWIRSSAIPALIYAIAAASLALAVSFAATSALDRHSDHGQGPVAQLRLLRLYDIVGAVVQQPNIPLDDLRASAPELENLIRTDGVRLYSPQRNDTLVGSPALQSELADTEPELMKSQWADLVAHHPWLYLRVRALEFGWVFLTPDIAACRPVFTGVEGPAGEMSELGIMPRRSPRDLALQDYAKSFMGTPFLSHVFYAGLALVMLIVLLRRRSPGDVAMAAMLGAGFIFTASFFVISIACDYRYLCFLDFAALASLLYLALDSNYLFQVRAIWSGSFWEFRSDARKS
jgi:hypothetical protein